MDTINIDGHTVAADAVDDFFHGSTGHRVTDEEWDESKRRVEEAEKLPDGTVTWEPVEAIDLFGDAPEAA